MVVFECGVYRYLNGVVVYPLRVSVRFGAVLRVIECRDIAHWVPSNIYFVLAQRLNHVVWIIGRRDEKVVRVRISGEYTLRPNMWRKAPDDAVSSVCPPCLGPI